MIENRKFYKLNEIFQEYKYVIPDTNAFLEYGTYFSKDGLINKICEEERRVQLFNFWKENFSKFDGLFITKNIFEELNSAKYNYKKASKMTTDNKLVVKLRRIKRDSIKMRNLFFDSINQKNIFSYEEKGIEKETYDKLALYYNYLNNCSDKIGRVDFDLLITGGVFAKLKGNTSIISNDFAIKRVWNRFMKRECMDSRNFGFYFQRGLGSFEKVFLDR